MDAYIYWLIALIIIFTWWFIVLFLDKKGVLEKLSMGTVGPIIMWKTKRGKKFLDRLSKPVRFWRAYGDVSIILCVLVMVLLTALLLWQSVLVVNIPASSAPSPELALGVPGLNPIIPLGYGILGLALAIVFHEFLHGILARTAKISILSLGILLFVLPIGAFVEPNEDEIKKMPRRHRARLFAVGPATNMFIALVFAIIFSSAMMSNVRPAHEGVGLREFTITDSPAQHAGLLPGMIIHGVNGTPVSNLGEFVNLMDGTVPGQNITITAYYQGASDDYNVTLIDKDGRAIMGVTLMTVTTAYFHPIEGAEDLGGLDRSVLTYITLPFLRLQPTEGSVADFYVVEGPWTTLPTPVFWVLANSFYWLFWLNLMLGATNALPAVPLDGGYIFRDGFDSLLSRMRKDMSKEAREKLVRKVSYALALLILALVLWQFIGPWLF